LKCDEASLTGESLPVDKDPAPLPLDVRISDRKNMILAGTTFVYSKGKAIVTSTGMKMEFGRIAGELTTVVEEKTPIEKRTEEIGRWLGLIAISIILVVIVAASEERSWMVWYHPSLF
jgi:Ca2+-transporting ATPase